MIFLLKLLRNTAGEGKGRPESQKGAYVALCSVGSYGRIRGAWLSTGVSLCFLEHEGIKT